MNDNNTINEEELYEELCYLLMNHSGDIINVMYKCNNLISCNINYILNHIARKELNRELKDTDYDIILDSIINKEDYNEMIDNLTKT